MPRHRHLTLWRSVITTLRAVIAVLLLRVEPDIEVDAATERLAALTAGLVALAIAIVTLVVLRA